MWMADHWPAEDLTTDAFLGGRLRLRQPRHEYRAGVDPVLLAAAIPARAGDSVLDLGCGAGAAALCLATRVPGVKVTGLEVQPPYAALAVENARLNDLALEVVTGDLSDMPATLRSRQFAHVMANPPYFDRTESLAARDAGRETAMGERMPLATWVTAAAKRAAPKGTVTFIQRAERLPALLEAASGRLGSLEVLPLIPRRGRLARLVVVRGRKGGRGAFRLHDGWLLHEGRVHPGDHEHYTQASRAVLREGAPLTFGG